jgi:hypothetical protein
MAQDLPISGLPANPSVAANDKIEVLDVSNTTNQATGENTQSTVAGLVAGLPVMVASGLSHAAGLVGDPGATAGAVKYWREDASWATPVGGGGTVTSITVTSPLTGGVITAAGSIGLGTVPITLGGTGQITAPLALNALLPAQSGQNGKVIGSDGTNASWVAQSAGSPPPIFSVLGPGGNATANTETSLFTGATFSIGSLTIPANAFFLGSTLRGELWGDCDGDGGTNVTLRVKIGGTVVLTGISSTFAAVSGKSWRFTYFFLNCQAVGASGNVRGGAGVIGSQVSVSPYMFNVDLTTTGVGNASGPVVINTTIANAFDLTAQFSASGGNRLRILGGALRIE